MAHWGIAVLSGGMGRRMGGVNKAKLEYRGTSFVSHIREELSVLSLPFFLSIGGDQYPLNMPEGWTVIKDMNLPEGKGHIGPMGGVFSCLHKTDTDGLFLVPCDMPLVRAELGRRLMMMWKLEYDCVIWKTRDGRLQPLCGLYTKSCIPALKACIDEGLFSMMEVISRLNCLVLETHQEHLPDRWFLNINDPNAYDALNRIACPVLAVSGRKNTGKTTLLTHIVSELHARGVRTAVIKHDGHEFEADMPGTDSFRLRQAGAYAAAVYSGSKLLLVKEQRGLRAEDLFSYFPEADLILLEGQKRSSFSKLEVLREEISQHSICDPSTVLAYVTDGGWIPQVSGALLSFDQMDDILELVIRWMDQDKD